MLEAEPRGMAKKKRILSRPVLRLTLKGPGVRRGHITVPDLLRICEQAQNTINKQAEALKGRKTIHRGPTTAIIQQECTLELTGIKGGSTTLEFGLAKPQAHFEFKEQFGVEVVAEVAATIDSLRRRVEGHVDPGVLLSIYGLSGLVERNGISSIKWVTQSRNGHRAISVPITKVVRERAAEKLSRPQKFVVQVDGVLNMADFSPAEKKCRIDPAIGASIICTFDPKDENQIYSLLKTPVRVKGEGTIQPYTDRIGTIHIKEINPLQSLSLGEGNFAANRSIAQLAQIQNVLPMKDPSILAGGNPDDENLDDFVDDIYRARK
jgi:hypothetical protein